jgi:hypothetical protein
MAIPRDAPKCKGFKAMNGKPAHTRIIEFQREFCGPVNRLCGTYLCDPYYFS